MKYVITRANTDGSVGRFGKILNGRQLGEVLTRVGGQLLPGFQLLEFSEEEIENRDIRVQRLWEYPIIRNATGGWEDAVSALRKAHQEFILNQAWKEIDPNTDLTTYRPLFPDCWELVDGNKLIIVSRWSDGRLMRKEVFRDLE